MEDEKKNKAFSPSENKKVKVKIKKGRAIAGVGKAGDVVDMSEAQAKQYEKDGYVEIVKENSNG